jgi:hypothetical protein
MQLSYKEEHLRRILGDDRVDALDNYAFEYACREAKFLHLEEICEGPQEYNDAFELLAMARRRYVITEVYDIVWALAGAVGEGVHDLAKHIELIYPKDTDTIDRTIRTIHEGRMPHE